MKRLYSELIKLSLVVLPFLFAVSCSNDDDGGGEGGGEAADKVVNEWVYGFMKTDYLWPGDIPSTVNTSLNYDIFFKSLLSSRDGRPNEERTRGFYSYIEKIDKTADTRAEEYYTSSYGFDFILSQSFLHDPVIANNHYEAKIYATIVCVANGSPAQKEGLKRGDHIWKINGTEITYDNYGNIVPYLRAYDLTSSVNVTLCELTQIPDDHEYLKPIVNTIVNNEIVKVPIVMRKDLKSYSIKAAKIDDTPIYMSTVLTHSNKKIGYLVYNQFERGGDADASNLGFYDYQLQEVFKDFKNDNITELVLDLRYNPGGYVTCMQLLASLIAPGSYTGEVLQKMVRNNGAATNIPYINQANTVGLNKIYILATGHSASASEALLHCLRGSGIEVIHIGNMTEGKNVGMTRYTSDDLKGNQAIAIRGWEYAVWPVTFYIQDSKGESYSSNGIDPKESNGYVIYEDFSIDLPELGYTSEPMLAAALYHIDNGSFPPSTRTAGITAMPGRGEIRQLPNFKPFRGILED